MIKKNSFPVEVTNHIIKFRDFLCSSWKSIEKLMEFHNWESDGNFIDDWIDCNWKFLVGRELLENIGDLAPLLNMYASSSISNKSYRIETKTEALGSLIDFIKKTKNYEGEVLLLSGFLTPCGESFGLYPPFDYVKLHSESEKKMYVIPISQCCFFLRS